MSLTDSGLRYCTAHHGVIDCDEARCDFVDPDDPSQICPTCDGDCFMDAISERDQLHPDARGANDEPLVRCNACDGDGVTACKPTPLLYEEDQ